MKEEKRKMRNSRKKRKRQEKSEKMRAILVEKAVREVRVEADKYRSHASKYHKLWKKSVEVNSQLKRLVDNSRTSSKVYNQP